MSISEGMSERFMNSAAEQRALKLVANRYCDAIGWPTIILLAVVAPSYFALPILAALGWVSHWFVVPAMAFLTYAAYTPMHEAAHGSVCGAGRRFRWVNDAVGYIAGVTMAIPYTAHRFEHFTHHAHTNDAERDPDMICADMTQSAWQAVVSSSAMLTNQYRFFISQCWATAGSKLRLYFVLEVLAIVLSRVLLFLVLLGPVAEVTSLAGWQLAASIIMTLLVGPVLGMVLLVYLFAYIVHVPHTERGAFVDTSVFVWPRVMRTLGTWLWGFQNYHGVHHVAPRVPWYRYRAFYEDHQKQLLANGLPSYTLQAMQWTQTPFKENAL